MYHTFTLLVAGFRAHHLAIVSFEQVLDTFLHLRNHWPIKLDESGVIS
jgi:hypothetical protein